MKLVNAVEKMIAAAVAISVTLGLVWSMAHLGYPGSSETPIQVAAATHAVQQR